ncbi:MAG: aspartate-semialdehyde dehydrogenase, partial [Proteobacteria bacterium]|nr:aspartate-semialdehyde dehydrogenase [Pseudomonadota bacterium]
MSKKFNVAVVGATGAVGETMLSILEERNFPVENIVALASSRSAGSRIRFNGKTIVVEDLEGFDFKGVDIGLFTPGASVSKIHVPRAVEAGCVVIDNTSQFRYDDDIPLVIPEVNPDAIADYKNRGIIANPNCSTIQMLVALKPIHDAATIERINVCTYQAVSGTGKEAIEELAKQTAELLNGRKAVCEVYPKQIAFNVIPHIDDFQKNGYTLEEMKMVWETQKIFEDDKILVNPTCARVPVFYGHSEAVHIETERHIEVDEVRALLSNAPGVELLDERVNAGYPTAVVQAAGTDPVFVGRIRRDISHPNGVDLWIVSDIADQHDFVERPTHRAGLLLDWMDGWAAHDHSNRVLRAHAQGTQGAVYRRLRGAILEGRMIFNYDDLNGKPLKVVRSRTTPPQVIDLHLLPRTLQRFVVAAVSQQIVQARTGRNLIAGLRYIIVLDELNRFAPRGAKDPVTRLMEEISTERRSQGVILFGAQQFAAEVSTKVVESASIRAAGRTGAAELGDRV